jgi:hypothetical protein
MNGYCDNANFVHSAESLYSCAWSIQVYSGADDHTLSAALKSASPCSVALRYNLARLTRNTAAHTITV